MNAWKEIDGTESAAVDGGCPWCPIVVWSVLAFLGGALAGGAARIREGRVGKHYNCTPKECRVR